MVSKISDKYIVIIGGYYYHKNGGSKGPKISEQLSDVSILDTESMTAFVVIEGTHFEIEYPLSVTQIG